MNPDDPTDSDSLDDIHRNIARVARDTAASFRDRLRASIRGNGQLRDAPMYLAAAVEVLEQCSGAIFSILDAADDIARDQIRQSVPRPTAARAPRPAAAGPRHKFGDAGTCVAVHGTDGAVCGKAKGRAGRPPAEPARAASEGLPGVVPPGYRAPLGDAAADKFEGGGLGSSGVRRG